MRGLWSIDHYQRFELYFNYQKIMLEKVIGALCLGNDEIQIEHSLARAIMNESHCHLIIIITNNGSSLNEWMVAGQ